MLILNLTFLDDKNDAELFERIYHSYRKQMFFVANSLLHNEQDAEDAVHEVFFNIAVRHIATVRKICDEAALRSYLLKAAKNTALDFIRKKEKRNISLETLSELSVSSDLSDRDFTEKICAEAEYEQVIQQIGSLDEKYRDVLYYRFVLELNYKEIAAILGLSVNTVKKQLVRGKKILLKQGGQK